MNNLEFYKLLDEIVPNPHCTLDYTKDYELLIATVLSAQCTDDRVNQVTPNLFKYNIYELSRMLPEDIVDIIRPCGNMNRKSVYIIEIAKRLVSDYDGKVPNNREYLEIAKPFKNEKKVLDKAEEFVYIIFRAFWRNTQEAEGVSFEN